MGLFSFIKDAGSKVFGAGDSQDAQNSKVAEEIKRYNISENVQAIVEGEQITLQGEVKDILTKQKVLTIAGNIAGISKVVDQITVASGQEVDGVGFYDVKPGDSLSKISKEVYGDPNKYNQIFEANKPMLTHVDKIYPGQKLVIPAL